jgi:hypothetical protein
LAATVGRSNNTANRMTSEENWPALIMTIRSRNMWLDSGLRHMKVGTELRETADNGLTFLLCAKWQPSWQRRTDSILATFKRQEPWILLTAISPQQNTWIQYTVNASRNHKTYL